MILFADDDASIRTLARRILESRGYEVITAENGERAIELHDEHGGAIDLSILDLTMPGQSGEDVLREIRRRDPNASVIICTGHDEDEIAPRLSDCPPTAVLVKPFRLGQLVEAVRRALPSQEG